MQLTKKYFMNIDEKDTAGDEEAMITPEERQMLDDSFVNDGTSRDNLNLQRAGLDSTDEDGEKLNELSNADDNTGADLDVPGAEYNDDNEALGQDDEENNAYSSADTD